MNYILFLKKKKKKSADQNWSHAKEIITKSGSSEYLLTRKQ